MPANKTKQSNRKTKATANKHKHAGHGSHGSGDGVMNPGHQHAFFVVGDETVFLVHMANLWMEPHRYQLILEVELPASAKRAITKKRRKLQADGVAASDSWFVLGNAESDEMPISALASGSRTSFRAGVWQGWPTKKGSPHWPWAGDTPVAGDIEVEIERVVYFRRLDFSLDYPRTANYILFGRGKEAHISHYVVKQPDYDHLATLEEAPSWLPGEMLELAMPINFPDIAAIPGGNECRDAVHVEDPIRKGTHDVQFAGVDPVRAISVDHTVFFGLWPINNTDPSKEDVEWRPGKPEPITIVVDDVRNRFADGVWIQTRPADREPKDGEVWPAARVDSDDHTAVIEVPPARFEIDTYAGGKLPLKTAGPFDLKSLPAQISIRLPGNVPLRASKAARRERTG